MAEAFAKPDSLPFISHYVQRRRKKRKSSLPTVVQRYFTDLTAAGGQYYSWSSNPAIDRLVFDVYSPTGSTVGLPAGTPAITANELQTVDFPYSGALPDIGFDGVNYFDGIIANIKAYDSGNNLLVDAPLDENWTNGNVAVNRANPANNATAENITDADAELFTQDGSDWLGEELIVNGSFDTDSDWTKGTGWTIKGGQASHIIGTGTNNQTISQNVLTAGNNYRWSYKVTSYTAGSCHMQSAGVVFPDSTALNTGTFFGDTSVTSSFLGIRSSFSSDFEGSVDDVSVKRILQQAS